jgi:predicted O-methyltransferase YrrM
MDLIWTADDRFTVDGVAFVCSHGESTPDLFCIRKPRPLVDATVALVRRVHPDRIVEIGIASGGSAALLALVAQPRLLVGIERDEAPVDALAQLIAARALAVSTYYGVDQSDHERLTAIIADEFGPEPIDLVIDDASHRFEETRASFETLFPRLAPGGTYVIEDWNWQLRLSYGIAHPSTEPAPARLTGDESLRAYFRDNMRPVSLEALALQLVLVRACSRDVVSDLFIDESRVVITRGDAQLDPDTFRVADHFADPHGILHTDPDDRAW